MTETLLLFESDVENTALTSEATDESLISTAKELNASYNGHLRRSIEDFWRLGQTLSHLFQRRHLQGRWADILKQVGINVTTDNHARRLHQATTLVSLSEFKNKTQALRSFGILSTPTPSVKVRSGSSPSQVHDESNEYHEPTGSVQISIDPEEAKIGKALVARVERPVSRAIASSQRINVESAHENAAPLDDQTLPIVSRANVQGTDDSLEVLVKIAALLEYLAADVIDVTPDHLAQIDRMLVAIDLIRSEGVVDAA